MSYKVQLGDSVTFISGGESKGFMTAIVVALLDKPGHVEVLTHEGERVRLVPEYYHVETDGRMTRLFELDKSDPEEATRIRLEYMDSWIANHTAAPVVREDGTPKRTRSTAAHSSASVVLSVLRDSEVMMTASEIIAAASITKGDFVTIMRKLKGDGSVVQVGERRGAKYGVARKEYAQRVATPSKASQCVLDPNLIPWIKDNGPCARADIMAAFKIDPSGWPAIAIALKVCDDIEVTGAKRGTRYSIKG